MKKKNILSIIVPVYNAEDYLYDFLNSFSKQTYLNDKIELIFIDNGSTDKSKLIIEEYVSDNKDYYVKYMYFDRIADSYAARNYGVKNSKGRIIAFTDSDCILEPNWIENILNFVKQKRIISGEVEIQIINKKNIWEVFDSFAHLNNKENAPKGKVATANLIVTRDDFMKVGFFQERFSGGDHDWSLRAKKAGFIVEYNEQIKVLHPSRKDYSEILRKSRRMAFGAGLNHKKNNRSLITLMILYSLKMFNYRTNIRYMSQLRKRGIGIYNIIKFNMYFFMMRIHQTISAYKGFKEFNVRDLDIK